MELGKGISTCRNCSIVSVGGRIKIGSNVFFSAYCKVVCHDQVIIGDNCIFGPNVSIYDHDHNYDNTGIIEGYKTSPITIEKNCWLGTNVTVLRGSQMSHDPRSSCRKNIIQEREKLLECGKVVDDIFVEDVVFGSPSTAAAVLLGGESNGWIEWKNEDGKTLKEISG